MAHDALDAYRADVAADKDALLVCDTTGMADALNRRIHDDTLGGLTGPDQPKGKTEHGHECDDDGFGRDRGAGHHGWGRLPTGSLPPGHRGRKARAR